MFSRRQGAEMGAHVAQAAIQHKRLPFFQRRIAQAFFPVNRDIPFAYGFAIFLNQVGRIEFCIHHHGIYRRMPQ